MVTKCIVCKSQNIVKSYIVGSYQYFQCTDCLALFLNPLPSAKDLNEYYQNQFEYDAGLINKRTLETNAKRIIQNLKKIKPSAKTILDIGSGYGLLLNEANRIGLFIKGVEPSIKLFRISKNEIQTATENMSLDEYIKHNPNTKFDLITAVHVIEHVNDPVSFINLASTLLNSGGILYIETPNIDSHLFHFEKGNYTFLTPPEHVCLLSKYSFRSMNIKNLKIKLIDTYSYPEHFVGITKKILGKQKNKNNIKVENSSQASNKHTSIIKSLKYFLFDKTLAQLVYRLLNIRDKGSVLELYFEKL